MLVEFVQLVRANLDLSGDFKIIRCDANGVTSKGKILIACKARLFKIEVTEVEP